MAIPTSDAARIARRALDELPLADATLHEAYFYSSLSLCVLDAVFSIGVTYEATAAVIRRYCDAYSITRLRRDPSHQPDRSEQEPLHRLVDRIDQHGTDHFAAQIVQNRQRTSPRGGILKSEAAVQFARLLVRFGVQYFEDLPPFDETGDLHRALQQVRGQGSGVSIGYFWMLSGADDLVKPDRMVLGYLTDTLGRDVNVAEARTLMTDSSAVVRETVPRITPRLLDYEIWRFQREQQLPTAKSASKAKAAGTNDARDPLLSAAAVICVMAGAGEIHRVMSGLNIGFSRALALTNELLRVRVLGLTSNGAVGPHRVLVELADLENLLLADGRG